MSTAGPSRDQPEPKPIVWFAGEIKTPPLSTEARREAGYLLRRLQQGETLSLPHSRPMPSIGPRCHELRIVDERASWRVFYRLDADAVVIVGVEEKRTQKTPKQVIDTMKARLKAYDRITG